MIPTKHMLAASTTTIEIVKMFIIAILTRNTHIHWYYYIY